MIPIGSLSTPSISSISNISTISQIPTGNSDCYEEKIIRTPLKRTRTKKRNEYMQKETVRKMIMKILNEKKMPEEKLAHMLGITVKSLKQLYSKQTSISLISKINLPLIKLYCATRFSDL